MKEETDKNCTNCTKKPTDLTDFELKCLKAIRNGEYTLLQEYIDELRGKKKST